MAKSAKKDNSTFREKKALRLRALADLAALGIDQPTIMETHGGAGKLWAACYAELAQPGVVFEKDPKKAERLAQQRPGWAVYEGDCENALREGIGGHVVVDLLDVDPYGGALNTIAAYLESRRPFAPVLAVVVNDGMRQALSMGAAWSIHALEPFVERYGNDLYGVYGEICGEYIRDKAAAVGYSVSRFAFYYCGDKHFVTHWYALLTR